jgi:hypothetical protein
VPHCRKCDCTRGGKYNQWHHRKRGGCLICEYRRFDLIKFFVCISKLFNVISIQSGLQSLGSGGQSSDPLPNI